MSLDNNNNKHHHQNKFGAIFQQKRLMKKYRQNINWIIKNMKNESCNFYIKKNYIRQNILQKITVYKKSLIIMVIET